MQYFDFGRRSVSLTGLDDFGTDIDQRAHTVTFGLDYRLSVGAAPVVARY